MVGAHPTFYPTLLLCTDACLTLGTISLRELGVRMTI
jgi:hypothetical protein